MSLVILNSDAVSSTVNVPLIREVIASIEANPDNWDQGSYGVKPNHDDNKYVPVENDCGTTMCFAGWALYLSNSKVGKNYPLDEFTDAMNVLGLSVDQANSIFHWFPEDEEWFREQSVETKMRILKNKIFEVTGVEV